MTPSTPHLTWIRRTGLGLSGRRRRGTRRSLLTNTYDQALAEQLPAPEPPAPEAPAGQAPAPRSGARRLIIVATLLLIILGAGVMYVSFSGQYQLIDPLRHGNHPAAFVNSLAFDLAVIVLLLLGLGLSWAGKKSTPERVGILGFSLASAAMGYTAADPNNWRSIAVYTTVPLMLAYVSDRVISTIRRLIMPNDKELSVWTTAFYGLLWTLQALAVVALYLLRIPLAPGSTFTGLRQLVLNLTPLPAADPPASAADVFTVQTGAVVATSFTLDMLPALTAGDLPALPPPAPEPPSGTGPDPDTEDTEDTGDRIWQRGEKSTKLRYLFDQHPQRADRAAIYAIATELAPQVDMTSNGARTVLYRHYDQEQATRPQPLRPAV